MDGGLKLWEIRLSWIFDIGIKNLLSLSFIDELHVLKWICFNYFYQLMWIASLSCTGRRSNPCTKRLSSLPSSHFFSFLQVLSRLLTLLSLRSPSPQVLFLFAQFLIFRFSFSLCFLVHFTFSLCLLLSFFSLSFLIFFKFFFSHISPCSSLISRPVLLLPMSSSSIFSLQFPIFF